MKTKQHNIGVILVYMVMVLLDWGYILWLKNQADIVTKSFFLILPILGYFYFTFAIISIVYMYYRKKIGISLACCVIVAAMIMSILSYTASNVNGTMHNLLAILIIVLNCWVIMLLSVRKSRFKAT